MKSTLTKCLSLALVSCFLSSIEALATNAPGNLVAAGASSSQVNLTWTDNSTDETGFTFVFDTNSGFTNPGYTYAGGAGTTSYLHIQRSAATSYYYKIKAEGNPASAWSAVAVTTTTPASLAASVVSSSQINLSWTGNAGNSNITGYTIAYATSSSFSGAVYKYVAGAGATSFNNTGLYPGTTYYYKIKAEGTSNSYDSAFTAHITATTAATAPNAPSGLTASAASSSQINLSWTDNSTNETGFEVKRAADSAFTQNVVWVGGIQGATYSDTGLSASTTYYYRVRAEGATQDSAYSASASAATNASGDTIPNAPSGLTATATSSTQVNLSWADNSSNETGFEIKRATDSGFTQNVVWIGGIQGSTYANTGLNPLTTYYYKVRAEGTAGKSAYSSAKNVATSGLSVSSGMPISLHFSGINAWMPPRIGQCPFGGKLQTDPNDPIWTDVQGSGAGIMRYGGNGVDECADPVLAETMDQYVKMVEAMRSKGIEPVLQVPVNGGGFSPSQAADIVSHVNVTNAKAVKYWVIGNEPDLSGGAYGSSGYTAAQVAGYFMPFASAMKAVDPTIKIIGPETAWYDTAIINNLTFCDGSADGITKFDITGTDGKGHYYVDILSFHTYPFDGTQDRSDVISKLGGFKANLVALKARLAVCNTAHGRTGGNALQIAVTEANINYRQPTQVINGQTVENDGPGGLGAKSFIGGQFWAELMGIAMEEGVDFVTFWSVIEGNGLSYISSDRTKKRPSYYHFQMMAQNFRGSSVTATNNQTAPDLKVKTFGAEDVDQIAVMIMNQDTASSFNYTVRLDTGTVSGVNPLKINVDAGVAAEYNGTLATESSIVLIFNASGVIQKKIEYKLHGHADSNLPPVTTTY